MKSRFCLVVLVALLFLGCKKEKPIIFEGQLLFTSKFPYPLGNRKIEIYQSGSSSAIGLSSGSTSSSAITRTAINGNFRLSFIPGTSSFIIFSDTNSNSLTLGNSPDETTFPRFSRKNIPDSGYNPATPILWAKLLIPPLSKLVCHQL